MPVYIGLQASTIVEVERRHLRPGVGLEKAPACLLNFGEVISFTAIQLGAEDAESGERFRIIQGEDQRLLAAHGDSENSPSLPINWSVLTLDLLPDPFKSCLERL